MEATSRTGVSVQQSFDYEANGLVVSSEVKSLEKHAKVICETIERVRKTTAEGVMKLGLELSAAQQKLSNHGNGKFEKWCSVRCGLSPQHARRMIAVSDSFKDSNIMFASSEPTALYLLSAPSCPEEATQEAIELAEKGERITAKLARDIIKSHCPDADEQEDGEQDAVEELSEWQPVDCFTSIRAEVRRWLLVCPPAERKFILETLQDIAAQIERKTSE
jgi:hypothetical protein